MLLSVFWEYWYTAWRPHCASSPTFESQNPQYQLAATVVAARMQKLWLAKLCCGKPMEHRMSRIQVTKWDLVITLWDESKKKVPGWSPRHSSFFKNLYQALGHSSTEYLLLDFFPATQCPARETVFYRGEHSFFEQSVHLRRTHHGNLNGQNPSHSKVVFYIGRYTNTRREQ